MKLNNISAIICLTGLVATAMPAHAQWTRQQHPFGAGIMLGDPTGLTGKYRMSMDSAIDGGLAYGFDNDAHMQIQGDYLRIMPNQVHIKDVMMDFYYGGGAQLLTGKKTKFGIRIPVGLSSYFGDTKQLEAFGEIAPGLNLVSSTSFTFGIDIGARYYF